MKAIIEALLQDPEFREKSAWNRCFFQADEPIIQANESGDKLFYIEAGSVRVSVRLDLEKNKNMRPGICDLAAGDIFGEACLHPAALRNASVAAITDSRLVEIDANHLTAYLDDHPVTGHAFFKKLFVILLDRQLRDNRRIESLLAWGLKAHDIEKHL